MTDDFAGRQGRAIGDVATEGLRQLEKAGCTPAQLEIAKELVFRLVVMSTTAMNMVFHNAVEDMKGEAS